MATTWAGTADNQLITRAALQNGVDNGYLNPIAGATITDLTKICTKEYIESVIEEIDTTRADWSNLTAKQCPTKDDLQNSTKRMVRRYWKVPTGYSAILTVKRKRYNSSTITTVSTDTITSPDCSSGGGDTNWFVGDTVYFEWSTGLYSSIESRATKDTTNCEAGSFACGPFSWVIGKAEKLDVNYGTSIKTPINPCV